MLSHVVLPAAPLIQIIIFYHSGIFLYANFDFFPQQKVSWDKPRHAEKVKAGPVPFLPFSSSSSVLLQLSVEPWETETSNKEWVDGRTKNGDTARQTCWTWMAWAEFVHVWTALIQTHRRPDGQTTPSQEHKPARCSSTSVFEIVSPRKYGKFQNGKIEGRTAGIIVLNRQMDALVI